MAETGSAAGHCDPCPARHEDQPVDVDPSNGRATGRPVRDTGIPQPVPSRVRERSLS